ncbi:CdaR family transcriptional regulator [Leucobacter luti]|uniref:PucR family transcriptional regulator n=1 Tax=Leucobacter luti TaxID=340320 RepID=UPI00215D6A98|nr:PucR family transcriptional regulator [Leucobacter luti]
MVPDSGVSGERTTFLALLSFPPEDPRVAAPLGISAPPLAARLARELDMLIPSTTPASWRAHLGLGATGRGVRSLITSLERVRAAGQLRPSGTVGRVTAQHAERQALAYLVRGLAAAPEVQEYALATLGPLIEHDAAGGTGHSGDLLVVLRAYLDHPTNRSLAAQRARLSRSVFYQRLALIEELLDVDLSDGTTIATLAVALLARGEG